jgi:hypothetical protein
MLFSAFSLCQSVLFAQERLCSTCNRSPLTILEQSGVTGRDPSMYV